MGSVAIAAVAVVAYGLVSGRLDGTPVTGPMVFVLLGIGFGDAGLGVLDLGLDEEGVRLLAEATLVLILYTDAIAIRVSELEREWALPGRMLGIGLPLVVAAGTAVGLVLLGELGVWEVALIAAILAPTDAALGQPVIKDESVPTRIRRTVSTESGLNDGLALPAVTLFIALAAEAAGTGGATEWLSLVARQVGLGVGVGVVAGAVGGWAIDRAVRAGWMNGLFRQLGTLALGVAAFALADVVGGNGFIAAFAAGLAFGQVARDQCPHVADFTEDEGHLLSLLTFLVFGATLAGPALGRLTPAIAAYVLLSLTLVRTIPIAISLIGAGVDRETVAFLGWFGPRGLASILFAVVALEELALEPDAPLLTVVAWTVLVSVFAHGASAAPWARRYASGHD